MFSPIKGLIIKISEPTTKARHAYIPLLPAVKTSQPRYKGLQKYTKMDEVETVCLILKSFNSSILLSYRK
ncbi:hypothetical protein NC99_11050 [Sunxiuqinia dokdonensis]|uniref:Uncharacterized protein n=1 Tax=Sunxiuqinia dokdonensis TaxID=1409788 RepID=A0A0L8VC75_9BACT|nr:hypothetical protein NC99_11050 [Sunxiuqinia dokdonensis]